MASSRWYRSVAHSFWIWPAFKWFTYKAGQHAPTNARFLTMFICCPEGYPGSSVFIYLSSARFAQPPKGMLTLTQGIVSSAWAAGSNLYASACATCPGWVHDIYMHACLFTGFYPYCAQCTSNTLRWICLINPCASPVSFSYGVPYIKFTMCASSSC